MLDAPVSGGVLAAETGTLTFMVLYIYLQNQKTCHYGLLSQKESEICYVKNLWINLWIYTVVSVHLFEKYSQFKLFYSGKNMHIYQSFLFILPKVKLLGTGRTSDMEVIP